MTWWGWLLIVLGIAFSIMAVRAVLPLKARTSLASATVMPYETFMSKPDDDGRSVTMYRLSLQLELPDGTLIKGVEEEGLAEDRPPYAVGTVLHAWYEPANPANFGRPLAGRRMLQIKLLGLFAFLSFSCALLFGVRHADVTDLVVSLPPSVSDSALRKSPK